MTGRFQICIVERDLFVSQDMSDSLKAVWPSADCIVYDTVTEARLSGEQARSLQLVLISANVDGNFAVTPDDVIWLMARKVIAFDARNKMQHGDWVHLNKPFSEAELIEAALGLTSANNMSVGQ